MGNKLSFLEVFGNMFSTIIFQDRSKNGKNHNWKDLKNIPHFRTELERKYVS